MCAHVDQLSRARVCMFTEGATIWSSSRSLHMYMYMHVHMYAHVYSCILEGTVMEICHYFCYFRLVSSKLSIGKY